MGKPTILDNPITSIRITPEGVWVGREVRLEIFEMNVDDTETFFFNVTAMKAAAPTEAKAFMAPMDAAWADHLLKHCGVEEERIAKLTARELEEPVISILHRGVTYLVDGHHRVVRMFRDGVKEFRMYEFQAGTWQKFLVDGLERGAITRGGARHE